VKIKHDHAFVVTCSPGYDFGLISLINAQQHYGTKANWEIAYEGFSQAYMQTVNEAFDFEITWTPISSLIPSMIDRRTDKSCAIERFWVGYWLLAHKLLREKKYKSVCVTQADQFTFVNLNPYFNIADNGMVVSTEYPFNHVGPTALTFGDDRGIWDRGQCVLFDSLNFIGQQHANLPLAIVNYQCEDAFKGEANHSVIALNRAVCRHVKPDNLLTLEGKTWVCDSIWGDTRLSVTGDIIINDKFIRMNGFHNRWWQKGRVAGETSRNDIALHNYNLIRDFMVRFNNMIPGIAAVEYEKGVFT
jgi:hypothetical protein